MRPEFVREARKLENFWSTWRTVPDEDRCTAWRDGLEAFFECERSLASRHNVYRREENQYMRQAIERMFEEIDAYEAWPVTNEFMVKLFRARLKESEFFNENCHG